MTLKNLFQPGRIGTMELKNRIVMPPMGTGFADISGQVTDRIINYYAERARGGAGLIIIEATCIAPEGKVVVQLCVYDDSFIPGLRRLARAVQKEGAKVCLQLHHGGRRGARRPAGTKLVAPSPIASWGGEVPHELTTEEVEKLVDDFGQGARRAKEAGFDAVEVHGGNAHLVAQFLSPLTNKRRDKYGGDLESRARFAVEICRRIREEVGPDYPFQFRLLTNEFIKGGVTVKDARRVAPLLVEAGVDAIHIAMAYVPSSEEGYIAHQMPVSFAPMSFPKGAFVHLAQAIKEVVNVPVIGVGRLGEPRLADRVIGEGKADFISMGRPLIADPALPNKAAQGKYSDIRPCIACNTCGTSVFGTYLSCAVNPEAGRESEYKIVPAARPKKVVIIGGGPAGMEAARIAALRGHRVTLLEKGSYLGGNLVPASVPSFKHDIDDLRRYLTGQMEALPVDVRLGKEASAEMVLGMKPEVVILATGAHAFLPEIPGVNKKNVSTAIEVLTGAKTTGSLAVVVGGGMVGCETAVFLAETGRRVTLVTRRPSDFSLKEGLAPDMEPLLRRWLLFELWPKLDIDVVARATFAKVTDEGLVVRDQEGKSRLVEGDSVVFALGLTANKELESVLTGKVAELYSIGDCVEPRQIVHAVHEGADVARKI